MDIEEIDAPESESQAVIDDAPESESQAVIDDAPESESQAAVDDAPESESHAVIDDAPESESQAAIDDAPESESHASIDDAPEPESQPAIHNEMVWADPELRHRAGFMDRIHWKMVVPPALLVSVAVSILAILRGGHIGPDYFSHLPKIFDPAKVFDFSWAHPPLNYALGHALLWIVGANSLPITLSILQVLINAVSLWWFFSFTYTRFRSRTLHAAFALVIIFLPVRVIHSASLGTDWMTIPVFVLVLYVLDRFLADRDGNLIVAALLAGGLALGFWSKYSFIAFFPALLMIMIFVGQAYRWSVGRFVIICAIMFVPPSMLVLYTTRASAAADSYMTKIWIPAEGAPGHPDMNYWDMFSVKAADLELFAAPQYFKPEVSYWFRFPHLHSYLGLSHMAIFTDTMNLFQNLPADREVNSVLRPDEKWRDEWKTPIMQASMNLGLLWTILALIGTPWLLIKAVHGLWVGRFEREYLTAFLGIFYFLVLFLPIPFVLSGLMNGYWTPRLILVPLLFFYFAGFLLLDAKFGQSIKQVPAIVFALVLIQCGLVVAMLI